MRTLSETFQALAMAVTFAEHGEWDTAKSFLEKPKRSTEENRTVEDRKRPEPRLRRSGYRL